MSQGRLTNEVWILGATGRVGRAVATRLIESRILPVLVGRDRERLSQLATSLDKELRTIVAGSPEEIATEISQQQPAIVINTIGPFTETTVLIARACLPCSHYVDLANDVISVSALLDLHEEAVAAGCTLVTGAGFGVLATESVVLKLCQDRPTPDRVRTDALASVALEAGIFGEALAATIIDGLPYGGRYYKNGRLVRNGVGSSPVTITTPDGSSVTAGSVPFGELIAAQRASGAPYVLAASSEVPIGPAVRTLLPFAIALSHIKPLRTLAKRRLANLKFSARERPRAHSWGHASIQWPDGTNQEGWLRIGDAQTFTSAVAAEVVERLLKGEGRPGSYTPGALFGPDLAEAIGGEFLIATSHERIHTMPMNTAAWIVAKQQTKLEVKTSPYTHPREGEIVIKNHAVAINPLDWIIQAAGNIVYSWVKYPSILGSDSAGEVIEVGKGVTRFSVGDRVIAHAVGTDRKRNSPAEGSFQEYTVVLAHMAAPIPDTLSYENATVLPLALSTAACSLFQKDQLALKYPSATPSPIGKTLLIWGGSTSVGCNAIQLAVAAGYEVITTASPRNFDYVKELGASQVFDYHSKTVVKDVIKAFEGKTIAGALAIGKGSAEYCVDIIHSCVGNKFVSMASPAISFENFNQRRQLPRLILQLVSSNVSLQVKSRIRGIRTKFIFGNSLMDNEVSKVIYEDFLPSALVENRYVAAPEPYIIGSGLEYIQAAMDAQKKGVSAKKVVVSL